MAEKSLLYQLLWDILILEVDGRAEEFLEESDAFISFLQEILRLDHQLLEFRYSKAIHF
jgi:hypothetical protein